MKRTFVAAFAAMLAFFAGCAGASSYCSEITDMWWNPRRIDERSSRSRSTTRVRGWRSCSRTAPTRALMRAIIRRLENSDRWRERTVARGSVQGTFVAYEWRRRSAASRHASGDKTSTASGSATSAAPSGRR